MLTSTARRRPKFSGHCCPFWEIVSRKGQNVNFVLFAVTSTDPSTRPSVLHVDGPSTSHEILYFALLVRRKFLKIRRYRDRRGTSTRHVQHVDERQQNCFSRLIFQECRELVINYKFATAFWTYKCRFSKRD